MNIACSSNAIVIIHCFIEKFKSYKKKIKSNLYKFFLNYFIIIDIQGLT